MLSCPLASCSCLFSKCGATLLAFLNQFQFGKNFWLTYSIAWLYRWLWQLACCFSLSPECLVYISNLMCLKHENPPTSGFSKQALANHTTSSLVAYLAAKPQLFIILISEPACWSYEILLLIVSCTSFIIFNEWLFLQAWGLLGDSYLNNDARGLCEINSIPKSEKACEEQKFSHKALKCPVLREHSLACRQRQITELWWSMIMCNKHCCWYITKLKIAIQHANLKDRVCWEERGISN